MAPSVNAQAMDRPRKMLAARLDSGETACKKIAAEENARVVARSIEHSGFTKQEVAFRLGFSDQSQISRWIQGQDNASAIGRLWSLVEMRESVLLAMAESANSPFVRIRHVVDIERRRA
jgi:hypothetical protein